MWNGNKRLTPRYYVVGFGWCFDTSASAAA
jgi:hypothetical protein